MNNLSNYDVRLLRDRLEEFQDAYSDPADIENFTIFAGSIAALDELLARREAAEKPVAYIDIDELERLADSDSGVVRTPNFGSGYQSATIPLFTAPPLPVVPDADNQRPAVWVRLGDNNHAPDCTLDNDEAREWESRGLEVIRMVRPLQVVPVAETVSSPVIPDGWALVPIEPTEEMMLHNSECKHHAWDDPDCAMRQTRRLVWANMIAAAPKPEVK